MNALSATIASVVPEFRAAGTDLSERRRSGVSCGPIVDLAAAAGTIGIDWAADGSARIGALTSIATIASDPRIRDGYPGIAAAAQGLATPQIRHMATLGGNLAQRSRCWYFRNPQIGCLKKGGADCPARSGNHLYHAAFDLGPCVAPHPSTMAMALLAYDATIATDRRSRLSVPDLLGDGSNGAVDHLLAPGESIEAVALPPPLASERALYKRAISRSHAEWPLVEICVRAVLTGGTFKDVRIAAGGVAPVPLRLTACEVALEGQPPSAEIIARAAQLSTSGAKPLPMTAYKLELLVGLVQDVVERIAT